MAEPSSAGGYPPGRTETDDGGQLSLVTRTPDEGNAKGWVSSHSSHSLFPARDEGTAPVAADRLCSRAISVRQPWAWALIHGGKDVENRGRRDPWFGAIGERVWVHAAKTIEVYDFAEVRRLSGQHPPADLAVGSLIGSVEIRDVHHASRCFDRLLTYCSPWAQPDQWHIVTANPIALPQPIAWRGALGLFSVEWE